MALTRLQLCHLCSILKIKWQDRIPNVEVLRCAHTVSVEALITMSQLCWAGRVRCMANSRLPKAVFYSELSQGKRSHGGQKLRFKDVLTWYMKKTGISHLGGGGSPESQMARTVEEGHVSCKTAASPRILVCTCTTTLTSYFEQFPMQQLSMLLQIPSRSDCPYESLFKIGLNSNTRQSSSATKDSHYYIMLVIDSIFWLGTMARDCPPQFFEV